MTVVYKEVSVGMASNYFLVFFFCFSFSHIPGFFPDCIGARSCIRPSLESISNNKLEFISGYIQAVLILAARAFPLLHEYTNRSRPRTIHSVNHAAPTQATMLSPKLLVAALLSATTVVADGAAIATAVSAIQNATVALGDTVSAWDGDLLGALPITIKSAKLLGTIHDATATAEASAALADLEAITVGLAVISLVGDVNTTLTALLAKQGEFDRDLLTPVVLINLEQEKSASNGFSEALIGKLPASFTETGEELAGQIEDSFDLAIDAFSRGIL